MTKTDWGWAGMNEAPSLVNSYFDNELEPGEHTTLRAWLLESSAHVSDFVVDAFVHTQLIDLLGPEQVRANAIVAAEVMAKAPPRPRARSIIGRMLVLAASIVFFLGLVYFAVSRPMVVATITGTRNVQWVLGAETRTVGSLLEAGDEIALDRGTLHLTFARGGQVALHGPARFRVDSDQDGRLLRGSLSAFAPEHAVGFTVRSGGLTVVDLGTEFYIELLTDDSSELQVFDGLVEVQFDEPPGGGPPDSKLQISQGRALRFDTGSGSIKSVEYDKTQRLPMSAWSQ